MLVYNIQDLPAEMIAAATTNREAKSIELMEAFETALASNVFMSFEDRIKSLLDALSIPISDDTSYNQFFIHSTKDLEGEVCRDPAKRKIVPVLPTLDQIHTEAKKRYDDKAVKTKQQADRKAVKDAKKAPAVQPAVA